MNDTTSTTSAFRPPDNGRGASREATLTDRYVWAVVHDLPPDQRDEVDVELRGLIADMLDDGPNGQRLERTVLVELGDPALLAARYRGSRRSLIGPELYPHWVRTTRLVASIVVPVVAIFALVAGIVANDGAFEIVAGSLWSAAIAAVNVGFWSTLGFAIAEREGARLRPRTWDVDDLDSVPDPSRPSLGATITSVVFALGAAALLVTQHLRGAVTGPSGTTVPFVDPDAWNGRAQLIVIALIGGAVVAVLTRRTGWTAPLVAANLACNFTLAAVALWLAASSDFINTAFFETMDSTTQWGDTAGLSGWVAAAIITMIATVDSVESTNRWRRYHGRTGRQSSRSGPA